MKGVTEIAKAAGIWLAIVVLTLGIGGIALALWAFLVFLGAASRADKALASLKSTLMPDEQLIEEAVQHRAFALFRRRSLVAITSSRILAMNRGLLGGFKIIDIQWKDLKDVTIEQNVLPAVCGSNLKFEHLSPGTPLLAIDGVESGVASKIYSRAQAEEQAWEEKRRIRSIEETRAASGGVYVGAQAPVGGEGKGAPSNRMLEEIQKAKELLDMGAVSDAEFQAMKAKILAGA